MGDDVAPRTLLDGVSGATVVVVLVVPVTLVLELVPVTLVPVELVPVLDELVSLDELAEVSVLDEEVSLDELVEVSVLDELVSVDVVLDALVSVPDVVVVVEHDSFFDLSLESPLVSSPVDEALEHDSVEVDSVVQVSLLESWPVDEPLEHDSVELDSVDDFDSVELDDDSLDDVVADVVVRLAPQRIMWLIVLSPASNTPFPFESAQTVCPASALSNTVLV